MFRWKQFVWIKSVKKLSKFVALFIKNYYENKDKGYILEVDVEYPKNLFSLHKDLPFLAERKKLKNTRSLFVTYITKKTMLYTEKP